MSKNLNKIVEILSDHQYHDGTSIGIKLNITRAAVWKIIKKLIEYDIPTQSVKGKGYILEAPLILLNKKKIQDHLGKTPIELHILEKLDSTNDYVKKQTPKNKKPLVCLAETQTAGKARMSRHWHSPFGENIYFTLLYPYQKDISELSGLSLVVGLAVCQAIELCAELPEPLFVKWPNDVIAGNQKMAGILIEIQAEAHGTCTLVIGIGINVNMKKSVNKKVDQPWTSIHQLDHQYHDRNKLAASLIKELLSYLHQFEQHGLNHFSKEWKKRDFLSQKTVSLLSNKDEFTGIGSGINEQGHLILALSKNKKQAFSSGDTTLLKKV